MKVENMPIDIIYTWVDDRTPGYRIQLEQHARTSHDTNPNRTRDNLDSLKYSLRSVEKYIPWVRNVYIFTARPQRPEWLNTANRRINLVHHDEVIQDKFLPTFNSYCIVSFLHEIKGLSDQFLYIEDDMLFGSPVSLEDFISLTRGSLLVYPRLSRATSSKKMNDENQGPWDMALSYCNHLLNDSYGKKSRCSINRIPLLVDKKAWEEMVHKWMSDFTFTRENRFRSKRNIAPEYLYPYFMLNTGRAKMSAFSNTYRNTFYLGLDNNRLFTSVGLMMIRMLKPKMYCLNDNFGGKPDTNIVNMTRKFLEELYPEKSSFEV